MQFDGTCGLNDGNELVFIPWFWWFYSDYVEACQYSGSWDIMSETSNGLGGKKLQSTCKYSKV